MAPECLVPVGLGAVPMCWLCAHVVTEHGAELGPPVECSCSMHDIYPADVLAARGIEPPKPEAEIVPIFGASYGLDGERDSDGPVVCHLYERLPSGELQYKSMHVQQPNRSMINHRASRLARSRRKLER